MVTACSGERRRRAGCGGEGGEAARPVVAAGWRRRLRSDAFDGAALTSTAFLSIFAFRYVSYIAPLVGQLEDLHGLMRLLLLGQLTKTLHVLQDEATESSEKSPWSPHKPTCAFFYLWFRPCCIYSSTPKPLLHHKSMFLLPNPSPK
ncbi:hypothetical protein EJB05_12339, partial [Eragrostis curvula]